MLKIRITLKNVDYEKIAEQFIPDAFQNASESSSLSMRIAGRLLVRDGATSGLAKSMMKLIPQQAKDTIAYNLILRNQDRFAEAINKSLAREMKGLNINSLRILNSDKVVYDMIKLELVFNEIDYNSVVEQLLPKLLQNMSEQGDKAGKLGKLFLAMGDTPNKMIAAAFNTLDQEAKDDLILQLLSIYREDIVSGLNHMAEQQKISAEVAEINFKSE